MYVELLLLIAVTWTKGLHLPESIVFPEDQPSAPQENEEKKLVKRQAAPTANPFWGFIPIFASSPVIQVHHIIHLQSPDSRCLPGQFPFPTPPRPTQGPTYVPPSPGGDGLENRFGATNQTTPAVKEPSSCVWAIVSCCSPGNSNIRYACFELLGCQGAFWDLSPCEPRVVQAAANTALMFYMSATPPNNQSNVIDFEAESAL